MSGIDHQVGAGISYGRQVKLWKMGDFMPVSAFGVSRKFI